MLQSSLRHICRWPGCDRARPRHLIMCGPHWRLLPVALRHAIWRSHRPRGELGFPGDSYLDAVLSALAWARRRASAERRRG